MSVKFKHLVCLDDADGEGWTPFFRVVLLTNEGKMSLVDGTKHRNLEEGVDYIEVRHRDLEQILELAKADKLG
jgi:hypothetical protein